MLNLLTHWQNRSFDLSLAILVKEQGEQVHLLPDSVTVYRNPHHKNSPWSVHWLSTLMKKHVATMSFVLRADHMCGMASLCGYKRWIVTERGGRITRLDSGLKKQLKSAMDKLLLRKAVAGIANSKAGQKVLGEIGIRKQYTYFIPNGIVPNSTLRRGDRHKDSCVYGFIGRLVEIKAVDVLLRAFAKHVATHAQDVLHIAGDGPQRENLENLARDLGIGDSVAFLGFQKANQVLFDSWDYAVVPSRSESFPNVILELWNHEVPVITSDIAPILEIVEDRVDAFVFKVDDVDALADALQSVRLDTKSAEWAASAKRKLKRDYSMEHICDRYEETVVSVLGSQQ